MIQTNDSNFARDPASNAVINTNVTAYTLFKQQRISKAQASQMSVEIRSLQQQVDELKQLIGQLVQHGNNTNTN